MKKKYQDIFTPESLVNELLTYIPIKEGDSIFEPTAGVGDMLIPLIENNIDKNLSITANELQSKHFIQLKNNLSKYGDIEEEVFSNLFDHFFRKGE